MSILIVDDSNVVRNVVRQTLELYGFKDIIEADNGVHALKIAKENPKPIRICIADVNMPEMDGVTLVGELMKFDSQIPIIMLTTETDRAKMAKAKELGAKGWLIKPFEAEKFSKVVLMFIRN